MSLGSVSILLSVYHYQYVLVSGTFFYEATY
ncbi:hypothetical protein ES708_09422 [subsurface metagenome]